jgi:hypothetical protein
MAGHRHPRGHGCAWQSRSLLERQTAVYREAASSPTTAYFREHAVEIGAEPVGQVIRLDRAAEPARVKTTDDPVSSGEPRDAVAEGDNLAGTVAERHDAHLGRTAPATLQHHQIERGCANPNENFPCARLRVSCRTISRSSFGGANSLAHCSSVRSCRRAMVLSTWREKPAIAADPVSAKRRFPAGAKVSGTPRLRTADGNATGGIVARIGDAPKCRPRIRTSPGSAMP